MNRLDSIDMHEDEGALNAISSLADRRPILFVLSILLSWLVLGTAILFAAASLFQKPIIYGRSLCNRLRKCAADGIFGAEGNATISPIKFFRTSSRNSNVHIPGEIPGDVDPT